MTPDIDSSDAAARALVAAFGVVGVTEHHRGLPSIERSPAFRRRGTPVWLRFIEHYRVTPGVKPRLLVRKIFIAWSSITIR